MNAFKKEKKKDVEKLAYMMREGNMSPQESKNGED